VVISIIIIITSNNTVDCVYSILALCSESAFFLLFVYNFSFTLRCMS